MMNRRVTSRKKREWDSAIIGDSLSVPDLLDPRYTTLDRQGPVEGYVRRYAVSVSISALSSVLLVTPVRWVGKLAYYCRYLCRMIT